MAVVEIEDRSKVDAPIAETFWQGVERHLRDAGFEPRQAKEVVHIMAYILPQSVLEQTKAHAKEITADLRKDVDDFRKEAKADRRWMFGVVIALYAPIIALVSAVILKLFSII
ncbi:hypothetical protein FFK22_038610 [Mycobacterium sp. KBS0706]|uniref:hypothetical protein n=1 Tax=Mycobacterium sp. KBS0706 TaxID=2578109 RepID=UPI00110FA1B1|nr:hypothetical protein [Mycobacterium sp. KBS0706]TSD83280.1 hypothetical protein FFK22_038610 [Mycobacterium sp. KBS0706]